MKKIWLVVICMRLIDADELMELYDMGKELEEYAKVLSVPIPVIRQNIKDMPIIDAVPVVRCRECKYNNSPDCPMVYEEYFFDEDDGGDTYVIDKAVDPEGFCSYGERKDGDA